jgi:hypothetical protein
MWAKWSRFSIWKHTTFVTRAIGRDKLVISVRIKMPKKIDLNTTFLHFSIRNQFEFSSFGFNNWIGKYLNRINMRYLWIVFAVTMEVWLYSEFFQEYLSLRVWQKF